MNFVKLYVGDYMRDTGTLTVAEHGAYLLMLMHHYATERPLPTGRELHRLLRAETKAERDAIDAVAARFWTSTDEGLTNSRAATEIEKANHQREVNRTVGKLGGRPKRKETESVSESVSERKPNSNPNQTPDTRNTSEPNGSGAAAPPPTAADVIFATGVPLLQAAGVSDRNARSMLGLMRKTHGETAVIGALQRCAAEQPTEPVAWLQAALKARPPMRKADAQMAGNIAAAQRFLDRVESQ